MRQQNKKAAERDRELFIKVGGGNGACKRGTRKGMQVARL
jgi:hypothetical protein